MMDEIRSRRDEILRIAARHGATSIQVFGSVARGEETDESDVDFLVEAEGRTTPWFPGGLINDLQAMLGRRVEVVTRRGLHPRLRDRVLQEARPL